MFGILNRVDSLEPQGSATSNNDFLLRSQAIRRMHAARHRGQEMNDTRLATTCRLHWSTTTRVSGLAIVQARSRDHG